MLASGTYTLIVATNQAHDVLLPLSDLAWEANVPLLAIRGAGLVGEVRVQVKELGSESMNARGMCVGCSLFTN